MTSTAVRVGLRVRPLTQKETIDNCTECLSFIPNEPQILIGTDKSFTYDYVFDTTSDQAQLYSTAASPLLHKFVDGFNATILAYGQTGSGKTFSMGTSLDNTVSPECEGIVPRCIIELFQILKNREAQETDFKYEIYVSFLELYNEEFIDLLNPQSTHKRRSSQNYNNNNNNTPNSYNNPTEVSIREDIAGNIYWSGVKEELCYSPQQVLRHLVQGSLGRTTGSTEMNSVSSRSHAIFSVILKQQKQEMEDGKPVIKLLNSKFHFVDLAGSERLKRTHAQGDRAKEGIAINSGLLALGNVISALGDETRRATHVPYRDSKLTRLLQDSLGGNSQTLMLACVSPADTNFMETLSTLKYANRARNIKNRVTVNQDFAGSSMEVNQLKALVSRLRLEIASLRTEGSISSATTTTNTTSIAGDDHRLYTSGEVSRLRERLQEMSKQVIQLTSERDTLLVERELGEFMQNDDEYGGDRLLENIGTATRIQAHPIIEQYQKTIQELKAQLDDTKDKLLLLETSQSIKEKSHSDSTSLQRFSKNPDQMNHTTFQKRRKHHTMSVSNSNTSRRKKLGRTTLNSSSTTNLYAARIATKQYAKCNSLSTSFRSKSRTKKKQMQLDNSDLNVDDDEYEDEGYGNDLQEEDIRHEEVKESIAKVRADIRKSMEILELVKPLEDVTDAWEEELKVFDAEEKRLDAAERMSDSLSDEGRSSLTPSPLDVHFINENETVPLYENTSPDSESKYETSYENAMMIDTKTAKYPSQLSRMLHQIQSDIKVKEELVSHLERSETEFTFMRRKFDEKIQSLHAQLIETQREKDLTVTRARSGTIGKTDLSTTNSKGDGRQVYELKVKNLMNELNDLKRKYSQATSSMQSTRNQNESILKSLKVSVETLKIEKKRLMQRMRAEADRVRDQILRQERKIQQLQRQQAKSNQVKKSLEREHEQQKSALKKRTEEISISANQLKQLTAVLKKAVREGGILDEKMLQKVTPIMGGSFAVIARGGGHGFPRRSKKKNPTPLGIRVTRKKQLLDKALSQYIQGKQVVVEMQNLLNRCACLVEEKKELEQERLQIIAIEREHEEITGRPMDTIAVELIEERIELITAEISYLTARIRTLPTEAAEDAMHAEENGECLVKNVIPRPPKHVTFADEIVTDLSPNDEWADIDVFDEQYSVPANAAPELAYDITCKLIKSFESDECKRIIENLVDDIMDLKMNDYQRQSTIQNLEKTVMDLRRSLISLKRNSQSAYLDHDMGETTKAMMDDMEDNEAVEEMEYMNSMEGHELLEELYEKNDMNPELPSEPAHLPPYPSQPLIDKVVKNTSLTSRDLTPSPDRFYNMIQNRLSWQRTMENIVFPDSEDDEQVDEMVRSTTMDSNQSPLCFGNYVTDHESSTSSIRSIHLRRSSIQSDMSSVSSWSQKLLPPQPPVQVAARRRLPAMISPLLSHIHTNTESEDKSILRRSAFTPQTCDRPNTPSVFDRLSQTPTRSSKAKINHRHSSGSVDELRRRWEVERRSASATEGHFVY
ncbi:hypothetical protein BDB01DRAFT_798988 [Pilobolus umbonatus]|nr:hypothetical protein BDB01DRAFT_798988 [Pilobolus umbonatus]